MCIFAFGIFSSITTRLSQEILVCDFSGTQPAANTPWDKTSFLADNLEFNGWTRGDGVLAAPGINDGFGFSVSASETISTLAEAIREKEYLSFVLEPVTGGINLGGRKVRFSIHRLFYHSPMQYSLFTSVDGFSEENVLFTTASTGKENTVNLEYSFIMPLSGYDQLTEPVEFRIYAVEAQWDFKDTSLTAFSIEQAGPAFRFKLSAANGGSAYSDPDAGLFEENTTIRLTASPEAGFSFDGWSGAVEGKGNPRTIVLKNDIEVTALFVPKPATERMEVGTNLDAIVDWTTAWEFVDVFKMSRAWLTRAVGSSDWESQRQDELPSDENGWPLEIPFVAPSDGTRHIVHTLLPAPVSGEYTVLIEGSGLIDVLGASNPPPRELDGGETVFSLVVPSNSDSTTLFLNILESDKSDPIRNIRVIRPGFETNYEEQLWNPLYLERLEPFHNLRFMDWQKTNGSILVSWNDRTTPSSYTQTRDQGVALEYMAHLSNTLQKDLWICIPHWADDEYVRQCARLLRDSVDPHLKIFIEYSNETWNVSGAFSQTGYIQDQGELLNLDSDGWIAGQKFCSLRSIQIWELFLDEFQDESRVVNVIATQSANEHITQMRIDALNDPLINPNYTMPDVLAIAPYFGINFAPENLPPTAATYPTVDYLLNEISPIEIEQSRVQAQTQKRIADRQGMRLVCYEGGQHFVGIFGGENDETLTQILQSANRDPRMYQHYQTYLEVLKSEGVELFSNFTFVSEWSKWGSWGVLESVHQPLVEAPKYRSVIDWIEGNAPDGEIPSVNGPQPISVSTVNGDLNSDGMPDLIFQDDLGSLAAWLMEGPDLISATLLDPSSVSDTNYRIAVSADFNRDGNEDLLFQHEDGTLAAWYMTGTTLTGVALLKPANPGDKNWRVITTADLNGDGNADLVFQHTDGTLAAWFMNEIDLVSATLMNPSQPSEQWTAVGTGDFNADGMVDIAFQHDNGTLAVWYMNGVNLTAGALLIPSNPGSLDWRVVSVADRNQDEQPDLLFQNLADGTLAIWYMNGVTLSSAQLLNPPSPGGTWKVAAPK